MSLTPDQIRVLESIRAEWNRAERDIKLAEQVCSEIVFPSINELRYAGRRVVDILHKVLASAPAAEIDALLADALFDCHRARHDAIDTATAKIGITIEIMVSSLRYESILPAYGDFPKLVGELGKVREKISVSRENRENRDAIYTAIQATDFPALVGMYREMQANEPIMRKLAQRGRIIYFLAWAGFILALIAIPLAIWLAYHPPDLPGPQPAAAVNLPLTPSNRAANTPSIGAKPDAPQRRSR